MGAHTLPHNMADEEEDTGPKYEYEGCYQDGKRHGEGVYKWVKTETDEESGETKISMDDEGNKVFQSKYTGCYAANLKDGEGVFEYPDGSKYQGRWSLLVSQRGHLLGRVEVRHQARPRHVHPQGVECAPRGYLRGWQIRQGQVGDGGCYIPRRVPG